MYSRKRFSGVNVEERWYLYDVAGRVTYVVQKLGGEEDANGPWYRGTQIYYNKVGQASMSKLIKWQYEPQGTPPVATPVRETPLAAMEYRYDSGRQRYLVRPRNPANLHPYSLSDGAWSDYAGDEIYNDYTTAPGGAVTDTMGHVPGMAKYCGTAASGCGSGETSYLHGNLIGTNEAVSDSQGATAAWRVFTAFGEPVYVAQPPSAGNRYGYAGAWGYQSGKWDSTQGVCDTGSGSLACDPLAALGWLHVGARYYDPQSGRFVQRDPIGIRGGINTYLYCLNNPAQSVDPNGEWFVALGLILSAIPAVVPVLAAVVDIAWSLLHWAWPNTYGQTPEIVTKLGQAGITSYPEDLEEPTPWPHQLVPPLEPFTGGGPRGSRLGPVRPIMPTRCR